MKKLLAVLTGFLMVLTAFSVVGIAHINPQGKQTHPVGIETESCQDALAGAEEQLADRGIINPRLLDNIEDKCGVECSIVSPRDISLGSCTDVSFIAEANLPQCCGFEGPQGGIDCGAEAEWVVGVTAFPTCYIPGS